MKINCLSATSALFQIQYRLNLVQHIAQQKILHFSFLKISKFFYPIFVAIPIMDYIKIAHILNSLRYVIMFCSTCYCNKNYISSLMQQFDDDCTIKCKGDDSGSCGGKPNFVSSYIADDSSK